VITKYLHSAPAGDLPDFAASHNIAPSTTQSVPVIVWPVTRPDLRSHRKYHRGVDG
jgi:hypothetical protein